MALFKLPTRHVLWPILLENHPVVLYGARGFGKSYCGLLFAYLLSLGEEGNRLDFRVDKPLTSPLYLDWEGDAESLTWRIKLLSRGMDLPNRTIHYRRCVRPLADDYEQIKIEMTEFGCDFVIVDSLGPACGGDLFRPDPALAFFHALRSLRVSSLILGQRPKNTKEETSIFGSSFFEYLTRSAWEAIRDQEEGEDSISVGLFHKKMNYGRIEKPIGLKFIFHDDSTTVEREDLRDNPAAATRGSAKNRVRTILKELGKLSPPDIAQETGLNVATVRTTLSRLRANHEATKFPGNLWGLVLSEDEAEEAPF